MDNKNVVYDNFVSCINKVKSDIIVAIKDRLIEKHNGHLKLGDESYLQLMDHAENQIWLDEDDNSDWITDLKVDKKGNVMFRLGNTDKKSWYNLYNENIYGACPVELLKILNIV